MTLEDLHWSDYATLDLLALLARRRTPAHLFVVGTYRPVEAIVHHHPLRPLGVTNLAQRDGSDPLRLRACVVSTGNIPGAGGRAARTAAPAAGGVSGDDLWGADWRRTPPSSRSTLCAARMPGTSVAAAGQARQLLADVYGWFTEGFDTADLQEAKALLDALC